MTDIAADMWDHQPVMKSPPPPLTEEEMRQILGFVWARQFYGSMGDGARGKKSFAEKHCATCHNDTSSGAPNLAGLKRTYSDIALIAVLWQHGPHMFEAMRQRGISWPRFTAGQMSDLIAYLNSLH